MRPNPPITRNWGTGAVLQSQVIALGARRRPSSLRGAALMPAAALAVHQLRYELAFGGHASRALAAQGHAYLSSLTPWIVLLAALGLGASLGGLAQRWAAGPADAGAPRRAAGLRVWLAATLALVAIYAGQELLESLFATGHAAGLAGVFGDGGWCALPVALLIGGLLTLALRGEAAIARALDGLRVRVACRAVAAPADARAVIAPFVEHAAPLAGRAAGRAPPRTAAPLFA